MMKIKLSYKLFAAFFLILSIVSGAMVVSMVLFSRNFEDYIYQADLENLKALIPILKKEYRTQGSWEGILTNKKTWYRRLSQEMDLQQHFPHTMDMPPHHEFDESGQPGEMPYPYSADSLGKGVPHSDEHGPLWKGMPPHDELGPPKGMPHGPPMDRILLMDARHQPIIGLPGKNEHGQMIAIDIDGQPVGWLALKRHEPFKKGPPATMLKHQAKQLFMLGYIVTGLTAIIAFLFSRHLLNPIQRLTKGTRELANRNFKVRIKATTKDELGQLAENFNAMAQTLENYERTRRQWLTDISHELRTPLTVLRGEIEALQDKLREPTADNLSSLHSEILRISKLVDDLHMTSMSDIKHETIKKEPIDPLNILRQIVDSYQYLFDKQRISLHTRFGSLKNSGMIGDADRLKQVFTNILENACKYVNSPGTLEISGKTKDSALILCFEDSGPGVPYEALPRLFDRLYRVDTSRSSDSGGSGLGLSICKHIVSSHGGKIWAEKSSMGGLSIVISLPINVERSGC